MPNESLDPLLFAPAPRPRAPRRVARPRSAASRFRSSSPFTPYHASGIYDVGETVGWTVTPGPDAADLRLQVDDSPQQRRRAEGRHAGSVDAARPRSRSPATSPEMIYVAVEAYDGSGAARPRRRPAEAPHFTGGNTGRNTGFYAVGAAVAPTKIGLSTPRPGRLRRVLGRQARRAGEDSDQRRC